MERWLQITCDGCGETECNTAPNETVASFRLEMHHQYRWRKVGRFDYCGRCVKDGTAARRENIFNVR